MTSEDEKSDTAAEGADPIEDSDDAELLELQAALSAKEEEKKQLLDKKKKQLRDKLNKTAEEVEHLKEKGDAKAHCGVRWYKVFENDAQGEAIFGSIVDLRDAVLHGAAIRVSIGSSYITSVQTTSVVDGNVCAEALFHISKAGYDRFQDNAYWWFVNVCTTGHLQMTRYNVGEHVSRGNNEEKHALKWFVRNRCGQSPILDIDKNGKAISGSVSAVIAAVNNAEDIRIVSDGSYSFPADNLEYDTAESKVGAMAIWSVSQTTKAVGRTRIKSHQGSDYWWFTIHSSDGNRHMSRWNVGDHVSRGDTTDTVPSKWFSDPCWKIVYQHDAAGNQTCGSLSNLLDAVNGGHRIKVVYKRSSFEADEVRTRGGHVCATVINDLSKSRVDSFQSSVHWVWKQICTTGVVQTARYKVGSKTHVGTATESESIAWYADIREWKKVLTTAESGSVSSGSKAVLVYALTNGAELRYRAWLNNESGYAVVHQADNIAISGEEVGAMHVRSISASFSGSYEVLFQSNPYWFFTIVSTSGRRDMSRWTVGVHTDRGHTNDKINVEWFVGE